MTVQSDQEICNVGLIGLGVMGRNLALNLADHGFVVAGFDLGKDAVARLLEEDQAERPDKDKPRIVGCQSLEDLISAVKQPRVIIVLVPAGNPVDKVCENLIEAGIKQNDLVVDGGNSLWTDTIRREKQYRDKLTFFGSGISGGEVGARYGPSLMPGGDEKAWEILKPIWEAIAARVVTRSGKPGEGEISGGEPCTTYIGANGAGHYVKMVHNGIEYADMQLIAEAYSLLRTTLDLTPKQIGEIFSTWNQGELESYLIEISADILQQDDPVTNKPLVDVILDKAGMKGTGTWTAMNALTLGVPSTAITEAVFARGMSGFKDERTRASQVLSGPTIPPSPSGRRAGGEGLIEAIRDALYCSKICAYAQGFQLMAAAQIEYEWKLNFGEIAKIWRGGCIIRAAFLQKITDAFNSDANLANLLIDPFFTQEIAKRQAAWREVVSQAALTGIPTPAFGSALSYYDGYRSETLPANLIQAQRDYFGAHTYERVDQPRGKFFHIKWTDPDRPQIDA